ncbi:MAG TPA: nitroreductase family protein [Gemmatimonadales bacterium]|nr:nitroreductase family protein [Gemmatimonadales bacterium]
MSRAPRFVSYSAWREWPAAEMLRRSAEFAEEMARRRTVRRFSDRPIPDGVLAECLRAAATAPSGANIQPWHFVVVTDPALKQRIREAAEREEREFYASAPADWLEALAPLGTDEVKEYLEVAPALIAVFAERYGVRADGSRVAHYYVQESVGIALGILITALHHAGLATLTHTPSPMGFLAEILERPARERAVLLLVAGFPAPDARVPDISRKPLDEVVTWR